MSTREDIVQNLKQALDGLRVRPEVMHIANEVAKKRQAGNPVLHSRDVHKHVRRRIKGMMIYGDVRRIAERCRVGYQRVNDVVNALEPHNEIWMEAVRYFNELPSIELDERFYNLLIENEGKEET